MRAYVDLHIHSCLSPCAQEDMLPYNICAMAKLKGLQAIAITDHNSTANLLSAKKAADEFGLELVPGMEVTTKEEVHILAYFVSLSKAMAFGDFIKGHLPQIKNRPEIFGSQLIVDENHRIAGREEALLIGATDLGLEEVITAVLAYGGVYVPAHINRGSYGLLQNLGFLPPNIPFPLLEVDKKLPVDPAILKNRKVLHASDAHQLGDILEACFFIDLYGQNDKKEDVFSHLKAYYIKS